MCYHNGFHIGAIDTLQLMQIHSSAKCEREAECEANSAPSLWHSLPVVCVILYGKRTMIL